MFDKFWAFFIGGHQEGVAIVFIFSLFLLAKLAGM